MLKGFAAGLVALMLVATPAAAQNASGFYAGIYGGMGQSGDVSSNFDVLAMYYDDAGTIEHPSSYINGGIDPVLFDFLNTTIADIPYADMADAIAYLFSGTLSFATAPTFGAVVGYGMGNGVRVEADVSLLSSLSTDFTAEMSGMQETEGDIDGGGAWTWTDVAFTPGSPIPAFPLDYTFGVQYQSDVKFLLASVYYDFAPINGVTPYLGAGAGLAVVTGTLGDVCGCFLSTSSTVIVPAGQLGGGARVAVTDAITLDIGYRFKAAASSDHTAYVADDLGGAVSGYVLTQSGIIGVHTLQVGLTFALP